MNTLGVYEPGSTFKILNTAIALESGKAKLDSTFDARFPIRIGRFTVDDFKGKYRVLSLTEAFIYSSNIAAIKIAQMFGMNTQKEYFEKFGLFKSVSLEIPEIGQPLVPARWSESGMMTMSYGYGISVTPLQSLRAVAAIVNNGVLVSPTLVSLSGEEAEKRAAFFDAQPHVVSLKTSASIRDLMRMVVGEGTAKKADVAGYEVIGKTGTAYQSKGRTGYGALKSRTTSFIGAFPKDNPQYAIIVMLDDPKPSKETYGYATAGWNAAPTAGKIISRIAPALGVPSSLDDSQSSAYWLNIAAPIHDDGE
jgi:cell division protein FtsI (penicillin-binding protein 3)